MSNPILLQDEFSGIFRDKSRDDLPKGKVWDLIDYIPNELGAPIRKRGGWSLYGDSLTSIDASAGAVNRVGVIKGQVANHVFRINIALELEDNPAQTYSITFQGQTTSALDWDANASTITSALEALSNIAPGDVVVSADVEPANLTATVTIELAATYAATDLTGLMTVSSVTGSWPGSYPNIATVTTGGSGGGKVVAIDDRANPELFNVTDGIDEGSVYGANAPAPLGPLVGYRNLLLIPSPSLASSPTGPRSYDGSTVGALSGSPPGTRFFTIYKDRVVAASADTDTPTRVYFSAAGNAESWDTTNRWIDTSAPPVGLAPLRNMLLVFHESSVERIRGSIPPGSAAANMELEPLFDNLGLADPFALHVSDEYAYWADDEGVYRTDGSGFTDLTRQGGIKRYWSEQFEQATGGISLSVWRGFVWISLLGGSDSYVNFLVYDIERRSWFRFRNIRARCFAHVTGEAGDELVFANRDSTTKQVGGLASTFDPDDPDHALDGNNGIIIPILDTPFYRLGGFGKKRWRHVYLSYNLEQYDSHNPTLELYAASPPDPESTGLVLLGAELPETSLTLAAARQRRKIGKSAWGMFFRVQHTGGDSAQNIRIYAIEADVAPQEGSKRWT